MKFSGVLIAAGAVALMAGPAAAQTVGIGTTKTGATSQVTAAIAKVVSQHGGMQMRPNPMGGTQQYVPAVNSGQLEFGAANIMQTTWSVNGTVTSKGRPNPNLRMVATLMKFRVGPLVAKDSGINDVTHFKGKRLPAGFKAAPLFVELVKGVLSTKEMSYADVKPVQIAALVPSWKALMERKIDGAIGAVGSGFMNRISQAVGGIRFVSLDDSPAAVARMQKLLPGAEIKVVQPAKPLTGVEVPTKLLHFDYMLFASKDVSDDVVYRVAKAMFQNKGDLVKSSPLWRSFNSKTMSKKQGDLVYHPGAVKLYEEKGTWNR